MLFLVREVFHLFHLKWLCGFALDANLFLIVMINVPRRMDDPSSFITQNKAHLCNFHAFVINIAPYVNSCCTALHAVTLQRRREWQAIAPAEDLI